MVKLEKLYAATDDGLRIIAQYYPQAPAAAQAGTKFKVRESEKTPSATIRRITTPSGLTCWKVTDFGDEGHALSPIDIVMKEEACTFNEAILKMAALFDVRDELDRSINKPIWDERPAKEEEKEGEVLFELKKEIDPEHLKVLGPRVTAEHCKALSWFAAEWVGTVKNRKVRIKRATENYPIFVRECKVEKSKENPNPAPFFKIYEPLNPDKGFRFRHAPRGEKPAHYINGLAELKKMYTSYNSMVEEGEELQKIGEAVICSGERDALCCKSMGFAPIWFNSETYQLSEQEFREIAKYAENVYNIPDLDETGRRKGTELALKFIDVRTVWLPEVLATYRDNRGKPCKDFRDWCGLGTSQEDFRKLLTVAQPAKFWTEEKKSDRVEYRINSLALLNFFQLNGFRVLKDEAAKDPIFIHIRGNVVERVQAADLRRFLMKWATERYLVDGVRALIVNSPRLVGTSLMEAIEEVDLDFTRHRERSQYFFFQQNKKKNVAVEVSADGITVMPDGAVSTFVWDKRVIPHKFSLSEPPFKITHEIDERGKHRYDIEILNPASPLLRYLMNSSRLYWRKELEDNFEGLPDTARKEYFAHKHFCIDGEGLTEEEIYEQKLTLINKIFTIGYMLHGYKSPERAWAPYAMDYKIGADGECNGRSGKSLLFTFLAKLMNICTIDAKNISDDNKFAFSRVDRDTDIIFYDDMKDRIAFQQFYSLITAGVTVNGKHTNEYRLEFEEAPKVAFSTNYAPSDLNKSTLGRTLFMLFSDYYHQNDDGADYRESRSVADDFGRPLWTANYPEEDWNADFNFALFCCQFYLSVFESGVKIQPPMQNILLRRHKADMGENFEDWADVYFSPDGGNLDRLLVRATVFNDYTSAIGNLGARYSMKRFTQQLKAFCEFSEHIHCLNPRDLQNSQGRIVRRVDGKIEEHIYLRSTKAAMKNEAFNAGDESLTAGTDDFVPDETNKLPF